LHTPLYVIVYILIVEKDLQFYAINKKISAKNNRVWPVKQTISGDPFKSQSTLIRSKILAIGVVKFP